MFGFGGGSGAPSPFSQMSGSQRFGALGDILTKNPTGLASILGSLPGSGGAPGMPAGMGQSPEAEMTPPQAGGQGGQHPIMAAIQNMIHGLGSGGGTSGGPPAEAPPQPQPPALTVPQLSIPQVTNGPYPGAPTGGSRFGFNFSKRAY